MSRQQQLLHGNLPGTVRTQNEEEQIGTIKRTLMTKNARTSEKRRRNISSNSVPSIKRELKLELNDEVCLILKNKFMLKCLFRKIQQLLALDVVVVLLKIQLGNAMDQVVC